MRRKKSQWKRIVVAHFFRCICIAAAVGVVVVNILTVFYYTIVKDRDQISNDLSRSDGSLLGMLAQQRSRQGKEAQVLSVAGPKGPEGLLNENEKQLKNFRNPSKVNNIKVFRKPHPARKEAPGEENASKSLFSGSLYHSAAVEGVPTSDEDPLRRPLEQSKLKSSSASQGSLFNLPHSKVSFKPDVEYLGTLLDAGRHYFPLEWLYRMVDALASMNYNLLHLRLTDDQSFNVLLESYPELAYPTAVNNPQRLVYTTHELRNLTAYAALRGIRIMPEINLPGHAGSWAGIPNMIVQCPRFACEKGYGLPLNTSNPALRSVLASILTEIVDIFDSPPFLHLGGDEVHMATQCISETGTGLDGASFETLLRVVLRIDVGYPESQVVRWEASKFEQRNRTSFETPNDLRAGKIEQFWQSHPDPRHIARGKVFISTWLYFDTNGDQDAYDVYERTRYILALSPTAIIAGTFELSAEFWFDRNVLGRLLAVAMGASSDIAYPYRKLDNDGFSRVMAPENRQLFNDKHAKSCEQLGWGKRLCEHKGVPLLANRKFYNRLSACWDVWKQDICERLALDLGGRMFPTFDVLQNKTIETNAAIFWNKQPVRQEVTSMTNINTSRTRMASNDEIHQRNFYNSDLGKDTDHLLQLLRRQRLEHTGVILDVASNMFTPKRLWEITERYIAKLGFNLIQLPLVNNHGFVYRGSQPFLAQSMLASSDNPLLSMKRDLRPLVERALQKGISIMPEISISTDAAGWYRSGFLVNCPMHFCEGHGVPIDVNNPLIIPLLINIIDELVMTFSSDFIHLGSDERLLSMQCYKEAKVPHPHFEDFEGKMSSLLLIMSNITSKNIVRWHNYEGIRYPQRVGDITQLQPHHNATLVAGNSSFATIDLLEGSGWELYQRTLEFVDQRPLGLMAQLRTFADIQWDLHDIPQRLLAFAMGVSEQPKITIEKSFTERFKMICDTLEWGSADDADGCKPPAAPDEPLKCYTDSKMFHKERCMKLTEPASIFVPREVKPFYDSRA